ncbi:MAG TPA: enoyl-CoA hydratase-related protein [Azospirillaceae bacterium]|nr:enoyl-CoA hydratase-related protein [Azospirillaceae bacterium]
MSHAVPAAEPVILVQRAGTVVTVVLNRPDRMNAMNKAMWLELGRAMRDVSADDTVRCVVLRGAGGKAFSPGADITEFDSERATPEQAAEYGELMGTTTEAIGDCPHPTVALIEGNCVGAGLAIALTCDLRICGEGSRFGVPVNRLGVSMPWSELATVVAAVGRSTALEILFEARVFGAAEAKEKGIVSRVVADAEVEKEAYAMARRIADGAPFVNRVHKRLVRTLARGEALGDVDKALSFACFATSDYREGLAAFLGKRKPVFQGK